MTPFSILPTSLLAVALSLASWPLAVLAANDCQPATWDPPTALDADAPTGTSVFGWPIPTMFSQRKSPIQPGEINCRHWGRTYDDANYYTCYELAEKYDITVDHFFLLNPGLQRDCSNVQPNVVYCVAGFIEPLRAFDGLCGPPNKNATCLGTDFQCCNAETFTCGNSAADCADGTCYEGACLGDKVWSTDGTCGYQNRFRWCAGKWGDCCSKAGKCGTGDDFCGSGRCQSGKCVDFHVKSGNTTVPWLTGNTTDGTCGGAQRYTCNVVHGNCCNKNGVCGSLPSDCGDGCQPQFGLCSSSSSTAPTAISKTSSSLKATGTGN